VVIGAIVALTATFAAVTLIATTARGSSPSAARNVSALEGVEGDGFTVWERNTDGTPVRFDPCSPIDVVLNADQAPPGARADLQAALARIAEASGLDLRLIGDTDEPPSDPRLPYQPERYGQRWAPVLVTWARPTTRGVALRDVDRGIATPVAVGPRGDRTYVSGQVVLNADRDDLRSGFEDREHAWGATLLHELAHLVGLGHVDDPAQLLYVYPGAGPVELGDGDLAGLAAVGDTHGCREVPPPGPVRVARPASGTGHGVD